MHTHIKLGAHALLNIKHSYCVDSRSLYSSVVFRSLLLQRCLWGVICSSWPLGVCCSSVDFRSYAPALNLEVYYSSVAWRAFSSNTLIGTTCILHSRVVVASLHCRQCWVVVVVVVVVLNAKWNKWSICETLLMISICELLLLLIIVV